MNGLWKGYEDQGRNKNDLYLVSVFNSKIKRSFSKIKISFSKIERSFVMRFKFGLPSSSSRDLLESEIFMEISGRKT